MKKLFAFLLITTLILSFTSCADDKTIGGKTYRPYGIFNEGSARNPNIVYEVSAGAAISGVIFSELLLIPTIYTYGFNLWEPVRAKSDSAGLSENGVR